MSKIRILATEDDTLHEEMLRITLDKLGYELIDVVYKPSELFIKINATRPDLLLMDIDLGEDTSGIDLVKEVNEKYDIPVIYVTSFADSETFQEAKKTYPAAYVVKPYNELELQHAIELAFYNKQNNLPASKSFKNDKPEKSHIFIRDDNALIKLDINSILLIEAYDKYCFIYTPEKKRMIRYKLKDIFGQLPSSMFCQVHRSYIVNTDAIEKITVNGSTIFIAGKEISVSKTYKHELFAKLNCIA
jgi:DNA-binding LytR/AlgR family response regulator